MREGADRVNAAAFHSTSQPASVVISAFIGHLPFTSRLRSKRRLDVWPTHGQDAEQHSRNERRIGQQQERASK
jgi:hypothetical protein